MLTQTGGPTNLMLVSDFVKCFRTCVSLADCQKKLKIRFLISEEILREARGIS